jgi:hypothetical protein
LRVIDEGASLEVTGWVAANADHVAAGVDSGAVGLVGDMAEVSERVPHAGRRPPDGVEDVGRDPRRIAPVI